MKKIDPDFPENFDIEEELEEEVFENRQKVLNDKKSIAAQFGWSYSAFKVLAKQVYGHSVNDEDCYVLFTSWLLTIMEDCEDVYPKEYLQSTIREQ